MGERALSIFRRALPENHPEIGERRVLSVPLKALSDLMELYYFVMPYRHGHGLSC